MPFPKRTIQNDINSYPGRAVSATYPGKYAATGKPLHETPVHRLKQSPKPSAPSTQPGDNHPPRKSLERERFFVDVGVVDAEFVQGAANGCGHAGRAAHVEVMSAEVAQQAAQRCG
jgi:hypothetical protein